MHQHHRAGRARHHLGGERIEGQRGDVVDHRRAGRQARLHHRGLARIERDRRPGRGERPDHRLHPLGLVAFPDRLSAGPRRFPADVDQRRAGGGHLMARRDRRQRIFEQPAFGKAVRSDVDDSSDLRLIEPDHPLAEFERCARAGQPLPLDSLLLAQPRFDPLDGNQFAAVGADPLDQREPQQPPRQPRDLAVMAERRIDEPGRPKIGICHQHLVIPAEAGIQLFLRHRVGRK